MLLRALVCIADPRNTHFAGDAQVVAREALAALPNVQPKGTQPVAEVRATGANSCELFFLPVGVELKPGDKLYACPVQAPAPAPEDEWKRIAERVNKAAILLPHEIQALLSIIPGSTAYLAGHEESRGVVLNGISGQVRSWRLALEGFAAWIRNELAQAASQPGIQAPAVGAGPTGQQVIDGLRAAMEKANVPGDCRADLVGHFCNEWNRLHSASKPSVQGSGS